MKIGPSPQPDTSARNRALRPASLTATALLVFGFALRADTTSREATSPGKVNINQASATQIAYLPRIGAKVAARVVDYRKTHGQFARPE
ncbi:MAG TPA: helix-hairpin-helix domain-containing protein, partial [Thermoanaerobaculia bacterium]|nr:helix-hairpin-helix domain-containing protein [Thermoanaerobaculia bacterium]